MKPAAGRPVRNVARQKAETISPLILSNNLEKSEKEMKDTEEGMTAPCLEASFSCRQTICLPKRKERNEKEEYYRREEAMMSSVKPAEARSSGQSDATREFREKPLVESVQTCNKDYLYSYIMIDRGHLAELSMCWWRWQQPTASSMTKKNEKGWWVCLCNNTPVSARLSVELAGLASKKMRAVWISKKD